MRHAIRMGNAPPVWLTTKCMIINVITVGWSYPTAYPVLAPHSAWNAKLIIFPFWAPVLNVQSLFPIVTSVHSKVRKSHVCGAVAAWSSLQVSANYVKSCSRGVCSATVEVDVKVVHQSLSSSMWSAWLVKKLCQTVCNAMIPGSAWSAPLH